MSARYLIRLDDACESMQRRHWELVEAVLDRHKVKPIVAVIPRNGDPRLQFATPDPAFWDRVRAWERKGWTVAMHGYTHVMHATDAPLVLPYHRRSEFAGLPVTEQSARLRSAWELFRTQGLAPTVWVAPAHSFDLLTLEALRGTTPIRIISDGIAWDTWHELGFDWVPQQLWSLRERGSGLWTVCLHPNTMDEAAIARLDRELTGFTGRVVALRDVALRRRAKSLRGRIYHSYFWWRRRRTQHAAAQ